MDALFNQPPSAVDDHMYDLDRRQVCERSDLAK